MCHCDKCGKPCACGETYCESCLIDEIQKEEKDASNNKRHTIHTA
jgi:hypothetical protein